jgi:hypothetical protein
MSTKPVEEVVVTIVVLLLAGGGGGCVGRVVVVTVDVPTLLLPNRLLQPKVRGGFGGTGST